MYDLVLIGNRLPNKIMSRPIVALLKSGINDTVLKKLSQYLTNVHTTGHPLVITQNGKPAGVLISFT